MRMRLPWRSLAKQSGLVLVKKKAPFKELIYYWSYLKREIIT